MAETMSGSEFLDIAVQSGLLKPDAVSPYREVSEDRLPDRLIADGLLTRFQAKQLQARRHRGFFVGDKYKILDFLGKGGMSRVVLCEHMLLQRLVAVKLMDPALEKIPGAADRFVREARAAAAIDHRNVARLYDVDRSPQGLYMVMEYIDGINLQELVAWHGTLSPTRAAHYIRQAAEGLQCAHQAGLVHRDVKPGNLMLSRKGTIKVLDLGLARFFDAKRDDSLTSTFDPDAVLGTADFIAPEQIIDSRSADIRADIYSLGCTFYFLLLRKLPTDEGTTLQKLLWHQTKEAIPLRAINPDIPEELAVIVERMMRKDPAERYQTPAEVCEALAPFTAEPLAAPLESEMPRPRLEGYRSGLSLSRSSPTPPPGARQTSSSTAIPTAIVRKTQAERSAQGTNETSRKPAVETRIVTPSEKMAVVPTDKSAASLSPSQIIMRPRNLALVLVGLVLAIGLVLAGLLLPKRANQSLRAGTSPFANAEPQQNRRPAVALRGGGSTFAKPIMDHWAAQYEREKGRRIEYTAAGSSKGVEGVLSHFLDFGCSDAPLTDKQMQELQGSVLHVPLVMGAVVPTFNVADARGELIPLRFTGPLLANIFLGKITKWNDAAIAANNPGLTLPDLAITPVHRQDGSGTTHIWTDYLSKASAVWKAQVGVGSKVNWPVGVGAEKNNGVADAVSRTTGAIGYVELSYALANGLPAGIVKNRDGQYVKASAESITSAAAGLLQTIPNDLRYSLTDASGAEAYPIVGTTWALLHLDQPQEKRQELIDFLLWATGEGQKHVADLHYGRLPPELTPKIHAALKKVR